MRAPSNGTMKLAALGLVAMLLAGACGSGPRADGPAPGGVPAEDDATDAPSDEALIYSAVIRRLLTKDHTFGGGPAPFERVYVIDGAIPNAGDPMTGDYLGPAETRFDASLKKEMLGRLTSLPPVRFVPRAGPLLDAVQRKNGVVISLGEIDPRGGRVELANALWCGNLCGQWLTYVLRERDGRWVIEGTTGPQAIS